MKDIKLKVKSNVALSNNIYLMRLEGDLTEIKNPGEFINVKIPGYYLRRPFSVFDYASDYVEILYKVLGHGTKDLTDINEGFVLDCLVGLGNGFDINKAKKPLLIAGGIGIAPLYNLAKKFNEIGIKPTLLFGARSKTELIYPKKFDEVANIVLCTDDGSLGYKGTALSYLIHNKVDFDYYYACGPIKMLEAIAQEYSNGCVSLEARMGCGFGACMGCSINTTNGAKRVCKEGPVFEAKEVIFK